MAMVLSAPQRHLHQKSQGPLAATAGSDMFVFGPDSGSVPAKTGAADGAYGHEASLPVSDHEAVRTLLGGQQLEAMLPARADPAAVGEVGHQADTPWSGEHHSGFLIVH